MAPLLEVLNVSKFFGGLCALKDVSFKVYEGDIYGVIGPNGSGKTTLFNVISGVFRPDSGKVIFNGKDITKLPAHKIARLGIGRVYKIPRLFWNMRVIENVIVAARHGARLSSSEATKLALQLLELVGLGEKACAHCGELLFLSLRG